MRRGIYVGSFDPITDGHLWMIKQGALLFDELIIGIGKNPSKNYMFNEEERYEMVRNSISQYDNVILGIIGSKLTIDYAQSKGCNYILRGVRSILDYEAEKVMCHVNYSFDEDIRTIFLIPPKEFEEISSSFVKGLIGYTNWEAIAREYVPKLVLEKLKRRNK